MYKATDITTTVVLPEREFRTPWCEMLHSCSLNGGKVLHFWFPLHEIAKEVDMLTATLGKHRASETAPHLLDLINMTYDENPQFMSFAKTAMAKVFEYIGKYTKGISGAYLFDECHKDEDENKCFSNSIHYVLSWPSTLNENFIAPLDTNLFDALKYYIISMWLHIAYPNEESQYRAYFEEAMESVKNNSRRLNNVVINKIPRPF